MASPEHRDRSARLAVFGALAILVGAAAVLVGVAVVAMSHLGVSEQVDPRSAWVGLILYAAVGAVMIWVGVGSLRRRRWVRSVMLSVGWSWLLAGVMVWLLTLIVVDNMIATLAPSAEIEPALKVAMLAIVGVAGVLLPALFVWAYRDPDVLRTCEAHDPTPCFTDHCPPTVLGMSLALAASAALALSVAVYAVVPVFGYLVTGWPAVLLGLLGAAISAWLALATYRLEPAGWWGATLALALLGLSTAITFVFVEPAVYLRAMGHPEELVAMYDAISSSAVVWSTALVTVFSVVYMVAIRKHFGPPALGR